MKIPHKCPVCDGQGYSYGTVAGQIFHDDGKFPQFPIYGINECHACKRTGIIWEIPK